MNGEGNKNIWSVTVVKENFTEQRTIKKELKEVAGVSHTDIWRKTILGRGNSQCRELKSVVCLVCSRKNKECGWREVRGRGKGGRVA